MKIHYLGTGGGAGIPEMFCSCRICENARKVGGKECRNRLMALIDDTICLDLPCDARNSFLYHNVDAQKIEYLLISHSHYDHFLPENLISRPVGCNKSLKLFISESSGARIAELCRKPVNTAGIQDNPIPPIRYPEINIIEPFHKIFFGKYSVVALPSLHGKSVGTLNYCLSDGEKTILWLHDTGTLCDESKRYLSTVTPQIDFVSMDCFLSNECSDVSNHMNLAECKKTKDFLQNCGCTDQNSQFYLSHLGHLVNKTHSELEIAVSEYGIKISYDGEKIEI